MHSSSRRARTRATTSQRSARDVSTMGVGVLSAGLAVVVTVGVGVLGGGVGDIFAQVTAALGH
jgi:Flp pilus assembly pilin Flp